MSYLLDTYPLIDLTKPEEDVHPTIVLMRRLVIEQRDLVHISVITYGEFLRNIAKLDANSKENAFKNYTRVVATLGRSCVIEFDKRAAESLLDLHLDLRSPEDIPVEELMVAATAAANSLTLITQRREWHKETQRLKFQYTN